MMEWILFNVFLNSLVICVYMYLDVRNKQHSFTH